MPLDLDRAAFFDAVRRQPFAGHLTQPHVDGMGAILDACPASLSVDAAAYCLATTFHETARTMRPIEEFGRGKGRKYGPTGFWGRGYVQLTWEANYAKATKRLRQLGVLKASEDLVKTPTLAMRPDVAAAILFYGMIEGWFTGKKLGDYFAPGRADPVGARRIINGTDCDKLIAGYQAQFRVALLSSVPLQPSTAAPKPPDPLAPMTAGSSPKLSPEPAPTGGLLRSGAQATGIATRGLLNGLFSGIHNALARKA
ncbi:hypothetical protein ASF41_22885 [Methylobacterium sp. Leaf111]|uniref:hypothetical protein n=1 Tax=Methylobacterium sp. Leaf111 TaxID=1736257 RepID=UPI0006F917D2|nr:hypothetical protein [Methylobacterium sp. Leaf111]KQP61118.1 hypothetical protein ASF41_22885 [Methylobacterium sp. Leaf111]